MVLHCNVAPTRILRAPAGHEARSMGLKSTAAEIGAMLGPALVALRVCAPFVAARGVFLLATGLVVVVALASTWFVRAPQGAASNDSRSDNPVAP